MKYVGTSLENFSEETTKQSTTCPVCLLDDAQKAEVHAGRDRARPISYQVIAKWLREEHGASMADESVRRHFLRGHHHA